MNYLTGIRLRELPRGDAYLSKLPAVRYLYSAGQLDFPMTT